MLRKSNQKLESKAPLTLQSGEHLHVLQYLLNILNVFKQKYLFIILQLYHFTISGQKTKQNISLWSPTVE